MREQAIDIPQQPGRLAGRIFHDGTARRIGCFASDSSRSKRGAVERERVGTIDDDGVLRRCVVQLLARREPVLEQAGRVDARRPDPRLTWPLPGFSTDPGLQLGD